MALHQFFAEGPLSASIGAEFVVPLGGADMHHLRDVLRLDAGDEIIVAGGGRALRVRLLAVEERAVGRVIGEIVRSPLPRVTLVQGLAKGEKMDGIVRQATEVGVSRVVPFLAERSVVKLAGTKAESRVERWRRIAAEAAKQSHRAEIPHVTPLVRTEDLPRLLRDATLLVCWEDAAAVPGIGEALRIEAPGPDAELAVVVGPEGGLSAREVALLEAAGGRTVSLGATVLRTETAGLVAAALAIYERGGLGARNA